MRDIRAQSVTVPIRSATVEGATACLGSRSQCCLTQGIPCNWAPEQLWCGRKSGICLTAGHEPAWVLILPGNKDGSHACLLQALEHFVLNGWRERRKMRFASTQDSCRIELSSSGKDATVDIGLVAASPSSTPDLTG